MTFEEWWDSQDWSMGPDDVTGRARLAWESAQRYEREACALIAESRESEENRYFEEPTSAGKWIAELIRARGNTP